MTFTQGIAAENQGTVMLNLISLKDVVLTETIQRSIQMIAIHEFGHVLSMMHEHSRLYRDASVDCKIANVEASDLDHKRYSATSRHHH